MSQEKPSTKQEKLNSLESIARALLGDDNDREDVLKNLSRLTVVEYDKTQKALEEIYAKAQDVFRKLGDELDDGE